MYTICLTQQEVRYFGFCVCWQVTFWNPPPRQLIRFHVRFDIHNVKKLMLNCKGCFWYLASCWIGEMINFSPCKQECVISSPCIAWYSTNFPGWLLWLWWFPHAQSDILVSRYHLATERMVFFFFFFSHPPRLYSSWTMDWSCIKFGMHDDAIKMLRMLNC